MINRFTSALLSVGLSLAATAQIEMRYGEEIDRGWGDAGCVVTPYVMFPAKIADAYAGNRITKVYVGLCKDASNCYLYIKDKPETQEYVYRQKLGELKAGWNEVELSTPFELTEGEPVSIGYKASFAESGGVGCSDEVYADGDRIYYNSRNTWTSSGGSVCIKALVEGDNLPFDNMQVGKMSDRLAGYDEETVSFKVAVRNTGCNTVLNYELLTYCDGEKRRHMVEKEIPVNGVDTVEWEVPSVAKGVHEIKAVVDKVNGNADTYAPDNESTARLTVRDREFARRVVCEEYGGTWCGFCPKGIVGLEIMTAEHPDNFIGISIHGDDPLEINPSTGYSYQEFIESCPGAPMCNVNRKLTGDPYTEIHGLYEIEMKAENHVAYALSAEWNADGSAIDVVSTYYSDIDMPSPNFNIAYTITEDSITGYEQTNYYAGGKNGELHGWENKESVTTDFVYNDIARCIYGGYYGMECRREPMTAYERYEHRESVPVPATVSDKRNVKMTGQLIDNAGGFIVNAMRVKPDGDAGGSGVEIMAGEAERGMTVVCLNGELAISDAAGSISRVRVYNVGGRLCGETKITDGSGKIMPLAPGVYILSADNGETRKVTMR